MLPRAPDCYFTPEDVDLINRETGLEPDVILHWASNLRWRKADNFLGSSVASVEDYLKPLVEKVSLIAGQGCPMRILWGKSKI